MINQEITCDFCKSKIQDESERFELMFSKRPMYFRVVASKGKFDLCSVCLGKLSVHRQELTGKLG
jgi:hypothetical protein